MLIGSVEGDGLSDEDYELGWRYHAARMLEEYRGPAGTRPWGWWTFEGAERKPSGKDAEAVRLAELDELRNDELTTLLDGAEEAKLRIGTGGERVSGGSLKLSPGAYSVDAREFELWEAVEAALRRPAR